MTPSLQSTSAQQRPAGFFCRQIPTIREMLGNLDTLTINGRQHSMAKVLGFLRECGTDTARVIGRQNQRTVMELLDRLTLESKRPMPDVKQFAQRVESLLALLATTASA